MVLRTSLGFVRRIAVVAVSLGVIGLVAMASADEHLRWHIGVLLVGYSPDSTEVQGFREGLRAAGYSEGRDVVIEWRAAEGHYELVPRFATDLVSKGVDVIVVESTVAAVAAKRATRSIPIVNAIVADPLGSGLVQSLSHPEANMTGLSLMTVDLVTKRLQLLKEMRPQAARVGVLWNPATPYHPKGIEDLKNVAPLLGLELKFLAVSTADAFGSAYVTFKRNHVDAVYVMDGPQVSTFKEKLVRASLRSRLPSMYGARDAVEVGGLMSYGTNFRETFRRAASYVDRILKGAKPSDLPIEEPTRFELVVNLNAAHALGLAIPQSILERADEVIK